LSKRTVSAIVLTMLLASTLITTLSSFAVVFAGISEDGTFLASEDATDLRYTYPPLPSGTYDIVYDTETEAYWGPMLVWSFPEHLRVRFTPQANGQLVREARIEWAGDWGGDNTFEIHLVDADTGLTKTTPVITAYPWGWEVYDVSSLAFYTDGDFYIEFWAIGAIIGVHTDDTPPIYGRSEVNTGTGWFYPPDWAPSDFKIRAVVEEVVPATTDIHPQTLNLKRKGQWITAYIQLPEEYAPEDIDANTVLLNKIIQPVLDPKYDFVTNSSEYLVDHNEDGILERMVKFYRAEVMPLLSVGKARLTITGEVDGSSFDGSDIIRVIFK
jgi:hypothetical protein